MKHAKMPSAERTSKSLVEAAARPRAPIILTERGIPPQGSGELDWVKTRCRENHEQRGLEWNQKSEEAYQGWIATVARGRGCA
jgi:hypothetical protein